MSRPSLLLRRFGGSGGRGAPRKKSENAGGLRWMLTYADMITLLLVFFIILYALSNLNSQKYEQLYRQLHSIFAGEAVFFNGPVSTIQQSQGPSETLTSLTPQSLQQALTQAMPATAAPPENAALQQAANQIEQYLTVHHLNGEAQVTQTSRGVRITLGEALLFPLGSADLTPEGETLLRNLAPILKEVPNLISVEGYTDDIPIGPTSPYRSNWELSAARALTVLHVLTTFGVDPARLSETGYGEQRPLYPNDTPQHRQQNRRVDLVLLLPGQH
ncbi:MAG: flagellar motor protein MotB [Firmicutes bacterium]|nr:flagellar motor protein MotB [Bacillota bacterium]